MLIPNKHLDTPHYKLERLRYDDARLDEPTASWKMTRDAAAELESDTLYSTAPETVKPKREAAVKGITPDQPAPRSVARPDRTAAAPASGGLFSWVKKWLTSSPPAADNAPQEPAAPRQPAASRNPRQDKTGKPSSRAERTDSTMREEKREEPRKGSRENPPRSGNNNNSLRQTAGRQRNMQDTPRDKTRSENRSSRNRPVPLTEADIEQPTERQEQRQRTEQRERKPIGGNEALSTEGAHSTAEHATQTQEYVPIGGSPATQDLFPSHGTEESTDERRRRRRGRRGMRRERDDNALTRMPDATVQQDAAPLQPSHVAPRPPLPKTAPVDEKNLADSSTATAQIPVPVPATTTALPATHSAIEATAAMTPATTPSSPDNLQTMLESAGLVWVTTDASKVSATTENTSAAPAPRAPRVRKPSPPADATPLQQVETSHHP
jgi:ribonuclease E